MKVNITCRHTDITPGFRQFIIERIGRLDRYEETLGDAAVVVETQSSGFRVEIGLDVRKGVHLEAHAEGDHLGLCVSAAESKIEKQLRRFKRRINDEHKRQLSHREVVEELEPQARSIVPH